MTGNEVRSRFIEYFKKQKHQIVPSSRLIPDNDPTLLFTNAGMVQFKNVFLGLDERDYSRATTHQKCVRAGGKHNDLENVGFTARHHTFFEMLGNFSFGDYFKKEAIRFGWEFLTKDLGIPKEKLYVTIYETDDEAFEIWKNQEKIPEEKIYRFGKKDNFWQMADTGPCGPCSEIFYDHGPENGCQKPDCQVGCSCDRFVEIWNLVFMQFDQDEKGNMNPLPKPSIDTGAGLERISAVMQGVCSNYQTDLFADLFQTIEKISGQKYVNDMSETAVAMRVVADHCRATAFLITDGVLPSNEGRGYVLRRIMRRGIRYGKKLTEKNLFLPVIETLFKQMGKAYPELLQRKDIILSTTETEEDKFLSTLDQGTQILKDELSKLKKGKKKTLSGQVAFKLYDTYGFPLDLTYLMAKEEGFEIDQKSFDEAMAKQKEVARASWKGGQGNEDQAILLKQSQKLPKTQFTGYELVKDKAKVLALFEGGKEVKTLSGNGYVVLDRTPFYAEGGGQVGDQGTIDTNIIVSDTQKINDVFFHAVDTNGQTLKVGQKVDLLVSEKRRATMRNHSATHLLHAALRNVLGDHVTQAGSLVEASRLRFDFTHPKPMTTDEILKVEALVNEAIELNQPVTSKVVPYDQAIKEGAMALFGEKYADDVRVISMGDFSSELCGGTHVNNTSDIRILKISSEGGVSSGVRRIEGITGTKAFEYLMNRHNQLSKIEHQLKAPEGGAVEKIEKTLENSKKLERDLKKSLAQGQGDSIEELVREAKIIHGSKVVSACVEIDDRKLLSTLGDRVKDKLQSGVVVLIGSPGDQGGCPIVASVTKDLTKKFHAGNIVKEVATVMGGRGGGRPDFAQGAGQEAPKAQEAASHVLDFLSAN